MPLKELPASLVHGADNEEEDEVADVIASGDSVRSTLSSVGEYFSSSDDEENGEEYERSGTSFRRSTRIREQNVRLRDYEVDLPESLVIQSVNAILEPTSVKAALESPDSDKWVEALNTEYSELLRNNTWELVEKPVGVKVLTNKWVFVCKCKQEDVERHQARITIKGCQQKYGLDFWETYSSVCRGGEVDSASCVALRFALSTH
ncbi:Gag-pol Polyprotein [Phytophthora megakarya]|uniref:Gag-pol Polyprotein n=1 Tax=Phytophthora megakarya TaxID=4795 RepID=A0A225UJW4_9STRA|nr:Gag-pol Polyprotein [Phytophthora megakarya]